MTALAYIGLGSNLGDRMAFLNAALAKVEQTCGHVEQRSRVYESKPMGIEDQGLFLNAAVTLRTSLSPEELLRCLKDIERDLGRTPGPRYGPRVIDLDILVMGELVQAGPPTIPHPGIPTRSFVLQPLADLDPDLSVPQHGGVRVLMAKLGESGLTIWPQELDAPR